LDFEDIIYIFFIAANDVHVSHVGPYIEETETELKSQKAQEQIRETGKEGETLDSGIGQMSIMISKPRSKASYSGRVLLALVFADSDFRTKESVRDKFPDNFES